MWLDYRKHHVIEDKTIEIVVSTRDMSRDAQNIPHRESELYPKRPTPNQSDTKAKLSVRQIYRMTGIEVSPPTKIAYRSIVCIPIRVTKLRQMPQLAVKQGRLVLLKFTPHVTRRRRTALYYGTTAVGSSHRPNVFEHLSVNCGLISNRECRWRPLRNTWYRPGGTHRLCAPNGRWIPTEHIGKDCCVLNENGSRLTSSSPFHFLPCGQFWLIPCDKKSEFC